MWKYLSKCKLSEVNSLHLSTDQLFHETILKRTHLNIASFVEMLSFLKMFL